MGATISPTFVIQCSRIIRTRVSRGIIRDVLMSSDLRLREGTMKRVSRFLAAMIVGLFFVGASAADTLELRDGRVLKGKYLGGTQTVLRFELNGEVQTFSTVDIVALTFTGGPRSSPPPPAPPAPLPPPPPPAPPPPPPTPNPDPTRTLPPAQSLPLRVPHGPRPSNNNIR